MDIDNKIGLAGDWHGAFQWTQHAMATFGELGVRTIFHAGDFSLGWRSNVGESMLDICQKHCRHYGMDLYITPGNHENWEWINNLEYDINGLAWVRQNVAIMRRNTTMMLDFDRKLYSLGGAASIDFNVRTQGIDWWKEEMITQREAELAAAEPGIDIMICHDAPDGGTLAVQNIIDTPWSMSFFSREGLRYAREGRQLMNYAFYGNELDPDDPAYLPGAKPKVFVHGHFHAADIRDAEDTLFVSLGCNNQQDNLAVLDLETLQAEFIPIRMELPQWASKR